MDNLSAKEQLQKIDTILDEYEKSVGLPISKSPGPEEELQNYLNMSRDELEKLTPEICAEISYRIAQFCFYLKRLYNREQTRVIWARQQLMNTIAQSVNNYDQFTKFEIKVALITKDNEYANSLQKILTYAEERSQRLHELSTFLKHLSDSIKNIAFTKIQLIKGN